MTRSLIVRHAPHRRVARVGGPDARRRGTPSPAIGSPAALELEGTTWRLVKARLSGAYTDIPAEVTATLSS